MHFFLKNIPIKLYKKKEKKIEVNNWMEEL